MINNICMVHEVFTIMHCYFQVSHMNQMLPLPQQQPKPRVSKLGPEGELDEDLLSSLGVG